MKKILVTGANGFIGHHLLKKLLNRENFIYAIVRNKETLKSFGNYKNLKVIECSMVNFIKLNEKIIDNIDVVFHLAWSGVSDENMKDYNVQLKNIQSTLDLVHVSKKLGAKIFIATGSLHEIESQIEMKEDKIINNLSYMYKAAKISAHYMAKSLCGSLGIKFFWPIISNAYGPEEFSNRFVITLIRKMLNREKIQLTSCEQLYDFVFVEDVVDALILISVYGIDGSNYFIGSGKPLVLKKYVEQIRMMVNPTAEISYGEYNISPVHLPKSVFNIENLVIDTGYSPKTSFFNGINNTLSWFKNDI